MRSVAPAPTTWYAIQTSSLVFAYRVSGITPSVSHREYRSSSAFNIGSSGQQIAVSLASSIVQS